MPSPIYSAGARYERKALREKLERGLKRDPFDVVYKYLLQWVKGRQARYDKRPGGL